MWSEYVEDLWKDRLPQLRRTLQEEEVLIEQQYDFKERKHEAEIIADEPTYSGKENEDKELDDISYGVSEDASKASSDKADEEGEVVEVGELISYRPLHA